MGAQFFRLDTARVGDLVRVDRCIFGCEGGDDEPVADASLVAVAAGILHRIAGVNPALVGAFSVADECMYAESLSKRVFDPFCQYAEKIADNQGGLYTFAGTNKGVLTFPPIGGRAHGENEWVLAKDIPRVRMAIQMMLEDPQGLILLRNTPPEKLINEYRRYISQ